MIRNLEVKFMGCLNGMLESERMVDANVPATLESFDVAKLVASSQTPEILSAKLPPAAWTRSSSASVIGLVFHDRFSDVMDFCRVETLYSSPFSQCAALGASIMVSSACFDVPMGIWPNEVGGIIKGVDNYFVSLIDEATTASMSDVTDERFFKEMNAKADPDSAIVVMTMFSCLRGRSYGTALECAKGAGAHVASLVGAVMGAAYPEKVKAQEASAKEVCDLLIARRNS